VSRVFADPLHPEQLLVRSAQDRRRLTKMFQQLSDANRPNVFNEVESYQGFPHFHEACITALP
jgi:hypothetical protein